jgi:hypothetical protein
VIGKAHLPPSLPARMDEAAETLELVTRRYDSPSMNPDASLQAWSPANLRSVAAIWRLEDGARERMRDELADVLQDAGANNPTWSLRTVADVLLKIYDITPKVQLTVITAGGPDQ